MKGIIWGLAMVAPLWLLVVVLAGCGFNASMYPVSSAEQSTSWQPDEMKCLWGNCPKGGK